MFDSESEALGFFRELLKETHLNHWDVASWDERAPVKMDGFVIRGRGRRGVGVMRTGAEGTFLHAFCWGKRGRWFRTPKVVSHIFNSLIDQMKQMDRAQAVAQRMMEEPNSPNEGDDTSPPKDNAWKDLFGVKSSGGVQRV
jgi:hypothetical protein